MAVKSGQTRRNFLVTGSALGGGLFLSGFSKIASAADDTENRGQESSEAEEKISPAEDLMREHGILNRILLIYDISARRVSRNENVPFKTLVASAKIIRSFIEDYHAKLEEDHIFPLFEKAEKLVGLIKILREQHQAGRKMTDDIRKLAASAESDGNENHRQLRDVLKQFVRMYRPHEAREDTVVFPLIRKLVTPKQYDSLGDQFEDREHELFGQHGFENVVEQVADLEKTLDINDLSKFTPKI